MLVKEAAEARRLKDLEDWLQCAWCERWISLDDNGLDDERAGSMK